MCLRASWAILAAMNTRTLTSILMSALALAVVVAPASSEAKGYSGKTKAGTSISLKVSGNRASGIKTTVPTVCLETMGSYQSRAGVELFTPPGKFKLGKTGTAKELQPAAMNQGIEATKNYTVSLSKAKNGKVRGDLRVSFSFMRPGPSIYSSYIYVCNGATSFSARAR